MTFTCRICDDVFQSEAARNTHEENDHTRIMPRPPAGMRYRVTCSGLDCYLHHTPALYGDVGPAEFLAWAHESRFRDDLAPHVCDVKELNAVPVSKNPEAATGDKGGSHG